MKKLMIALSAATLVVLGAKAADPVTLGAIEGFEGRPVAALDVTMTDDNNAEGAKYWSRAAGKTGDSVVAVYAAPTEGNSQYLKVDETDVLTRDIGGATSIPANGGNITISTKVQFTAADEAPTAADDDKLLVWMQAAAEAEGTEGTEGYKPAKKNGVMVTDRAGAKMIKEVTDVETFTAAWHDLVIKAVAAGTENQPSAGFTITLDGVEYGTDTPFASRVVGGDKAQTISSIGFKGTGAVDDIGFVANEGYQPADITVTVATSGVEGLEVYTDAEGTPYTAPMAMKAGQTVSLFIIDEGYTSVTSTKGGEFTLNDGMWTLAYELTDEDAGEEGALTITITVTPAAPAASGCDIVVDGKVVSFNTFAEALEAIATADAALIKLTKAQTVDSMVTISSDLTIVLNGQTLSVTGDTAKAANIFQVVNGATLTIDGTVEGSTVAGRINVGKNSNDNGNLVMNGGTIAVGANTTVHVNGTCTNSSVTLTGVTLTSASDNGIQLNGAGTHQLTNCTISGATAVYVKAGAVTIKGCTISANGEAKAVTTNNNGADATGDAIVLDNCVPPYPAIASVSIDAATTISSANGAAVASYAREGNTRQYKILPAALKANVTEAVETAADLYDDYKVTVGFTVTAQANTTATITINSEVVASAPATVTEGDKIVVDFAPADGYKFADGATTHVEVTVGIEAVTITGPTATAIVPPAQNLPGTDLLPAEDAAAYNEWADANGITMDSTDVEGAAAALAFKMGLTDLAGKTIVEAEQAAVDAAVAKIDVSKLATDLVAAVAAIAKQYPNVKVELVAVPQSEIATTAKLYKLKISLKPLAE